MPAECMRLHEKAMDIAQSRDARVRGPGAVIGRGGTWVQWVGGYAEKLGRPSSDTLLGSSAVACTLPMEAHVLRLVAAAAAAQVCL